MISQHEKQKGIKSMGVSETWLHEDIQNIQNCKDWSDFARNIKLLIRVHPYITSCRLEWSRQSITHYDGGGDDKL